MLIIKQKISFLLLIAIITLSTFYSSGCTSKADNTISIGVVDWPESRCMSELIKIILEEEMNYNVELIYMDVDAVFNALAEGTCDIFLDCWLPITHEKFIYKYGSGIENLGSNFNGARTGLVVPSYVTINSIAQLNEYKNKFGATIVGIEPNAGIIKSTHTAIKTYNLDFNIVNCNASEMGKKLESAINNQEWIVVTGWSPHWKFSKWDLKFLDDPSFIYGPPENLHTVTRKNFSKDYPEIASFLTNFKLDHKQMEELLLINYNYTGKCIDSVPDWMQKNKALVNTWLYPINSPIGDNS